LARRSPTLKYQKFIDYWYENFPKSEPPDAEVARAIANGRIDPYAKIDMD
jgi:hypothetical protein